MADPAGAYGKFSHGLLEVCTTSEDRSVSLPDIRVFAGPLLASQLLTPAQMIIAVAMLLNRADVLRKDPHSSVSA